MMMISNWKQAYKFLSVQLLAVLIALASLEPFVPQIAALLPDHWVPIFGALVIVARVISQGPRVEKL
jgi:hypothetical protein